MVVDENVKEVKFKCKLDKSNLKKYKSKFNSDNEFNQLISELFEKYFKNI